MRKIPRLALDLKLSLISWRLIEYLMLIAIFFLPFSKSIAETGALTALAVWIFRKFPWNEKFPRVPVCGIAYALFLFLILLSLLQISGAELPTGIHGVGKWLKYLGIFFMSTELFFDEKRTARFTKVFLWSASLVCLDGLYQMWTSSDLIKHYSVDIPGRFYRMQGPFSSPNDLAAYLLLALPFAFFLWMEEKKWSPKSILLVTGLALLGVSFISTLSRAAFLSLFLSAFFYVLLKRKMRILWLVVLAPLVVCVSPLLSYNFFGSLGPKDITVVERLDMWQGAMRMIAAHPWLGNGVNTYTDKFASFSTAIKHYRGYAHNCYLQMASEVGIPALMVFLAPFFIILPKDIARNSPPKSAVHTALLIGIPAFLIQSALDTNFYAFQAAMLFWVLWGMLVIEARPGSFLRSPG